MSDERDERRYGHRSGSGANEPKHQEKKETSGRFVPRQGGDQSRDPADHGRRADKEHQG